ncbi:MAG: cupin domain-containing protein, partial [Bacteroidota bacterium]
RRDFIQKMGLFSGLCLTGIPAAYSEIYSTEKTEGLVLKANKGETWYIGNERKAEVTIKIAKNEESTPEFSLLTEKIPPGDAVPIHKHLNEEEFLFVQKGNIDITLGDTNQQGNVGDLIYVPKNLWHGFQNTGKEEVILFFGYSPSGFEAYFRAIGTKTIEEALGFTSEDWKRTNKKFGVVYRN